MMIHIRSLRDKAQVEQLLSYVVEEVPDDAEKKCSFKFPFIACEIFTCEIHVILRTLVEDEELMDLLFSFVNLIMHTSHYYLVTSVSSNGLNFILLIMRLFKKR